MSAETEQAIADALVAHLADVDDEPNRAVMPMGWVAVLAYTNAEYLEEGSTGYLVAAPETQPWHVDMGLAQWAVQDFKDDRNHGDDDD